MWRNKNLTEDTDALKLRRFEALVLPHLDAAYNLARWLTRQSADADDLVQEAYLRAFKFFASFRGDNGRAWLLTIVRNTCYTALRQKQGEGCRAAFDDEADNLEWDGAPMALDFARNNPEAALLRNAEKEWVNKAVEQLPLEFPEVLVLRELEDLTYKEIAVIVDIPIGTVMSRLARARKQLLEIFQRMERRP
ncbi:MAG: sigma-70 family RNA polymerase sigma factor [Deltaproteobacteria bacterium]|nr:sigma-70 family RNA polymerase sigma factor [Deltaproteobacteria bacterium]